MTAFVERHFGRAVFLIWAATSIFLLVMGRDAIAAMKVGDPDDALRIVQVRDWLAGQDWADVTQYRMNLPDGGPMHWSRLVDLPIAALILLTRPWLGQAGAEQAAAAIVPLLTYALVLALYAAAARRLWGAGAALLTAATLFLILPVIEQLLPMRIDHHGWQIVAFCAALWAFFDPRQRLRSAAIIGLSLAIWMEISVEALPFAALFFGLLALRWLWLDDGRHDDGRQLLIALCAFALGQCALFMITEDWQSAANLCDGLSPLHLAASGAVAVTFAAGWACVHKRLLPDQLAVKIAVGAASALAGGAALLAIAPQCSGDAFATLDPLVRTYWFDRGAEGLPLWALPASFIAQPLAGLAAGMIACIWLWRGDNAQPRANRIALTLLFVGCAAIGAMVSRTILYALLVGQMLLAPMALRLFAKAAGLHAPLAGTGLRLAAVGLLMSAMIGQNLLALQAPVATSAKERAETRRFHALARACQSPDAARALGSLAPTHFMAPLDSSPSILLFTQHKVVATGHHRNAAAMADVIRTFIGSAEQARQILHKRRIDRVLTCEGSFELAHYTARHPDGLAAMLHNGKVPDWLEREQDIGPFHIFKVRP